MINLHIVNSNGYGHIDIKVSENISIEKLKENIEKILNLIIKPKKILETFGSSSLRSPKSSRNSLYYGSFQLNDTQTINDYNIKDGSIIYFSIYKY